MLIHFLRAVALSFFATLFFSSNGFSQGQVGADWDAPSNVQEALTELEDFSELGITHLIISKELNESVWQKINELEFRVYGNLAITYPVAASIQKPDSTFLNKLSTLTNHYLQQASVTNIGLFKFGQINSNEFQKALQPIIAQIDSVAPQKLYYITLEAKKAALDRFFDFKLLQADSPDKFAGISERSSLGGYIYAANELRLRSAKQFLEYSKKDSVPAFFNGAQIITMTENHPQFKNALSYYSKTGELVLALPQNTTRKQSSHNLIIILLLTILGAFVVNYHYSPIFRKILSRYFTARKFLVNDIIDRHIRTTIPALVVLVQHAIAAGIVGYCLGNLLISEQGWQAIRHYYPGFFITQNPLFMLLIWAFLMSLFISIIGVSWIRFTNKKVTHFSQVLLLYSCSLQLNFMLTLFIVTLMISGFSAILLYLLAGLFMMIYVGAFIITVFDTSNYLTHRRTGFLLASIGICLAPIAGIFIWVFNSPLLLDVLSLATSLS